MPELPEVEVTRLSVADRIAGGVIQTVQMGKPLRWPLQIEPAQLVGRQVVSVGRRGKYLLFALDEGVLLVHLGMSGSLAFAERMPPAGAHDHFTLTTTRGILRLHDPRRFGAIVYAQDLDVPPATQLLSRLGVEPLSDGFQAAAFVDALRVRHACIKQLLLAGTLVVGVGNIYACEVLYLAGIHPRSRADKVARYRLRALHGAIKNVLAAAVAAGGSTLRDFRDAHGDTGHFQVMAHVYGREGQACKACGTPILRIMQGQRSTYYCPSCQCG